MVNQIEDMPRAWTPMPHWTRKEPRNILPCTFPRCTDLWYVDMDLSTKTYPQQKHLMNKVNTRWNGFACYARFSITLSPKWYSMINVVLLATPFTIRTRINQSSHGVLRYTVYRAPSFNSQSMPQFYWWQLHNVLFSRVYQKNQEWNQWKWM